MKCWCLNVSPRQLSWKDNLLSGPIEITSPNSQIQILIEIAKGIMFQLYIKNGSQASIRAQRWPNKTFCKIHICLKRYEKSILYNYALCMYYTGSDERANGPYFRQTHTHTHSQTPSHTHTHHTHSSIHTHTHHTERKTIHKHRLSTIDVTHTHTHS